MNIEWDKLGFEFRPTKSNIRFHYADGKWSEGVLCGDYNITVSVAANAFHYGQAIFEGLKAFTTADGRVCATCRTVMSGFRRSTGKSEVIPPEIRNLLER